MANQPKEDQPFEPGATHSRDNSGNTERLLRALAEQFMAQGSSLEEAEYQALMVMEELNRYGAGRTWGGLHAEAIPQIVVEAMRQGARRLVLEIEAEGERDEWFGHLNIALREVQTWQEWENKRQERAQKEKN